MSCRSRLLDSLRWQAIGWMKMGLSQADAARRLNVSRSISLDGPNGLHLFHGGTLTGVRYRGEILDPDVHPYAGAIGNYFILMDDNARPHRVEVVADYLRVMAWRE
ncbi:DDE_3 domain-containing protein [Trichonephila clavipes]|nr:DDE_3 domain-containing protein [Trichonephila clavipes]